MKKHFFLVAFAFFVLGFTSSYAQEEPSYFRDSTDNAFDISGFLNTRVGFMPVPLLITEPAVGYGGGLGLVFFHNKKIREGETRKGQLPPVMTVGLVAMTENGTKIGFVAHQGSYKADRFRYVGAVGYTDVNLGFYGAGLIQKEVRYDFNIGGWLVFQEFLFRPNKKVPLFIGLNYLYFNNDVTFKTGITQIPALAEITSELDVSGINFVGLFDKRNNSFTPTTGVMTALEVGRFDEALGGQSNYWNFLSRTYFYQPIVKDKLFSGYRLNWHSKWDEVPFYELPFINLRGVQMLRYQGHHVVTVETEWRWQLYKRWSLVGFVGAGNTSDLDLNFESENLQAAAGGGFRYLIAKDYGIHAGIDVAKGPELWAWYLTVGSNWFR